MLALLGISLQIVDACGHGDPLICRSMDDDEACSDASSGEQERWSKQEQGPKRKSNHQRKQGERSGSARKRRGGSGEREHARGAVDAEAAWWRWPGARHPGAVGDTRLLSRCAAHFNARECAFS